MNRQGFIVQHYNSVFSGNVRMVNFFVFTYYSHYSHYFIKSLLKELPCIASHLENFQPEAPIVQFPVMLAAHMMHLR